MIVRLLVASVEFCVWRGRFPTPRSASANTAAAPAQPGGRGPRRQDLHANKKEKGRGREELEPPAPGRAQPSAERGFPLVGFSPGLWFFFHPHRDRTHTLPAVT